MKIWPLGQWRGVSSSIPGYQVEADTINFLSDQRIECHTTLVTYGRGSVLRFRAVGSDGIYAVIPVSDAGIEISSGMDMQIYHLDDSTLAVEGNGHRSIFIKDESGA